MTAALQNHLPIIELAKYCQILELHENKLLSSFYFHLGFCLENESYTKKVMQAPVGEEKFQRICQIISRELADITTQGEPVRNHIL